MAVISKAFLGENRHLIKWHEPNQLIVNLHYVTDPEMVILQRGYFYKLLRCLLGIRCSEICAALLFGRP